MTDFERQVAEALKSHVHTFDHAGGDPIDAAAFADLLAPRVAAAIRKAAEMAAIGEAPDHATEHALDALRGKP